MKWTPSQGQFSPKLRCASFCLLAELFMLPFWQLPLPNTPQQVFFLRTTDVVVQSCKTQNILSAFLEINEPIIFPVHPRTSQCLINSTLSIQNSKLRCTPPVGYLDMLILEQNAKAILTDS